ncbi:MAG: bifunctional riboflavin kinase/FAD synthetase [Flavobacterium sp.]
MKIYSNIQDFKSSRKTVLTLGTFDGVHVGHRKIIEQLTQIAKANALESVVLTFFPHPRMVLQDADIKLLNTMEEKTALMAGLGVDHFIIHPFDKEFSRLTAEEFVSEILVEKLQISKIIIGYDHRFGRNRNANIDDLIVFGAHYGFDVIQISAQEIEAVSVSSTKIRNALNEGQIALANQYLTRPYALSGTVETGRGIGKTIQFPTANLKIDSSFKLIPKNGVYAIQSFFNNQLLKGMMNIGTNPTVDGTHISIEIHFFDFDLNIYGQSIQIQMLQFIRAEQKFENLEALQNQLMRDKEFCIKNIF